MWPNSCFQWTPRDLRSYKVIILPLEKYVTCHRNRCGLIREVLAILTTILFWEDFMVIISFCFSYLKYFTELTFIIGRFKDKSWEVNRFPFMPISYLDIWFSAVQNSNSSYAFLSLYDALVLTKHIFANNLPSHGFCYWASIFYPSTKWHFRAQSRENIIR